MSKTLENMGFDELVKLNKELKTRIKSYETELSGMQAEIDQMKFRIDQLTRLVHGAKRERFIPDRDENQMTLPFEVEQQDEPEKQKQVITYIREKKKRENHPGRLPLPSHLPVKEITLEPKEDTTGMKCIGREVTDQLELIPAKLFIKRYIRPKYIKAEDEGSLTHKGIIANLPVFPIEKGMAGPGLLAQIMIDKFVDHLPIYRQIERFKREGIKIPSSTINGW